MRKTNSKEVKQAVKNYLLEVNEVDTIEEIAKQFMSEYGWAVARMGTENACVEWLRGLPIACAFYYWDIAELLAEWLDDTQENQMKLIEEKGDGIYWLLLARQIVRTLYN